MNKLQSVGLTTASFTLSPQASSRRPMANRSLRTLPAPHPSHFSAFSRMKTTPSRTVVNMALLKEPTDYNDHFDKFFQLINLVDDPALEVKFVDDLLRAGLGAATEELPPNSTPIDELRNDPKFLSHAGMLALVWAAYLAHQLDTISLDERGWSETNRVGKTDGVRKADRVGKADEARLLVFYPKPGLALIGSRGVGANLFDEIPRLANATPSSDPLTLRFHSGVAAMTWELVPKLATRLTEKKVEHLALGGHSLGAGILSVLLHMIETLQESNAKIRLLDQRYSNEEDAEARQAIVEQMQPNLKLIGYFQERTGVSDEELETLLKLDIHQAVEASQPAICPRGLGVKPSIGVAIVGDPVPGNFVSRDVLGKLSGLIGATYTRPEHSIDLLLNPEGSLYQPEADQQVNELIANVYQETDENLAIGEMDPGLLVKAAWKDAWTPDAWGPSFREVSSGVQGGVKQMASALKNVWSYLLDYTHHHIGYSVKGLLVQSSIKDGTVLDLEDPIDLLPKENLWGEKTHAKTWPCTLGSLNDRLKVLEEAMEARCWSNPAGNHFLIKLEQGSVVHGTVSDGELRLEMKNKLFGREESTMDQLAERLLDRPPAE